MNKKSRKPLIKEEVKWTIIFVGGMLLLLVFCIWLISIQAQGLVESWKATFG